MNLEDFATAISALSIPAVYGYYSESISAPYVAYSVSLRNAIHADGIVVYAESWCTLVLVTRHRDLTSEAAIEKLLTDNGISYGDPSYEWDEEHGIHIATYYFQLEEE